MPISTRGAHLIEIMKWGFYASVAPEVTLQLNAGDLVKPGGQDVFVGNYTTNSSNQTCGVGAETSLTVK